MPGRARRHKDRRNRRRDCGDAMRESVWRAGRAVDARDVARYSGAVRADAGRIFSAEWEKDFFRRERTRAVLNGIWRHDPTSVWATADEAFHSGRLFFRYTRADSGRRRISLRIDTSF